MEAVESFQVAAGDAVPVPDLRHGIDMGIDFFQFRHVPAVLQEVGERFRLGIAERAAEVVAGAERDDGEVDLLRIHSRLVNPVDDVVDASVAADQHQVALSLSAEPFGRLPAPFAAISGVQCVADVPVSQLSKDGLCRFGTVSVQ